MNTVNIKINGYDYTMKRGITILDASLETLKFQREYLRQPIPTLYYLKGVKDVDDSGVCVVEADGKLVNASTTRVCEGMEIQTRSDAVMAARREALAKILAIHKKSCIYCARSTSCVNCGQCVAVCPVGALTEKPQWEQVKEAIADPEKFVVVQVAPAVRAALGETFEFPLGVDTEGRIAGALRKLGFDKVFDTKVGADLTIIEEANELIERIENGGVLPMLTSCCPGWIKYAEHFYPDMLDNLSSCKSPHTMFGALIKSWYAEKMGIPKEKIVTVSVMPCTAKKFEITRPDECGADVPDVDYVITTNELGTMLKDAEIQLEAISPSERFDEPLGEGTGAGVIFGASGGVMEAALRTAVEKLTGKPLENLEFTDVRGMNGIKEASYDLNGTQVKVAVVSGLANANALLTRIKTGEADYQFVEIMACPGGCVNGGGQPHQPAVVQALQDVPAVRAAALYLNDDQSVLRKSHENPELNKIYADYLGKPGSEKAHKLLHTSYIMR